MLRRLRQSPMFTLTTVITLALGIGANSAAGPRSSAGAGPPFFAAGRFAVISYGYWQRRFGGNASVLGRRILIDGKSVEVSGVLPAGFRFLDRDADIFQPLRELPAVSRRQQSDVYGDADVAQPAAAEAGPDW
jgi:hypothetical protein